MTTAWRRFERNLPRNLEEWITAVAVLALGLIWLVYPKSFARPDMSIFTEYAQPHIWTASTVIIGIVGIVGLAIQQEIPRTGNVMRSFASLARVTLFGAFIGRSLAASDDVSIAMGVVCFTALFALELRNCWKIAADTFNAFRGVRRVADFDTFLVR